MEMQRMEPNHKAAQVDCQPFHTLKESAHSQHSQPGTAHIR